tara:strand:- start:11444 stop:14230 length:2787 start_codon:yes stop_codon:yes gene_type:complete
VNIKIHATLVLLACTVSGLSLGGFLVNRYWHIETKIREVEPASYAMRSVKLLSRDVGRWMQINDNVLSKDNSHMTGSSIRQATNLRELVSEIAQTELAEDQGSLVAKIRAEIGDLSELIQQTGHIVDGDRKEHLGRISKQADTVAAALLATVEELAGRMQRGSNYRHQDLEEQRDGLALLAWLAGFVYFVVVWLCWLWIVHRVVNPIEELSSAAGKADHEDRDFELPETGPDEVRKLTENISSFVLKLQDAKANTEEEVRQRTEELVQASQAKGQFLATMSHELRTPLNGIINMNELILDTQLDGEQTGFAKTAKNAAEALLSLINDILDFSKIEARKLDLEEVDFDLRAIADGATEILAGVAESKNLELQSVVAANVPALVVGDPTRLRQVLINLLSNALKFTSEGSVGIVVSVIEDTPIDTSLRIAVRDTGIGIPEDRRESLFRAFEQVDSSTTRKYGGTGLGLAICRELVGLMGGELDVESTEGEGSTFSFCVRLGKSAAVPAEPIVATAQGVVIVSKRAPVKDRLLAQLQYLGVPESALLSVEDASDVRVPQGETWLAIVDPYQRGDTAQAEVARVAAAAGIDSARVAVLDHWMRHWQSEMGPAPQGALGLTDPTNLEQLASWLAGGQTTITIGAPPLKGLVEPALSAPRPESICNGRILVAEDNPVNQRVVSSILKRSDFEVVIVDDGKQALDAFLNDTFDLVLMDCQMPIMDGLEATRLIRNAEHERVASSSLPSRIPIVALTANTEEGFSDKCFEAGMDRFLSKPCRKQPLLETLFDLLGTKSDASETVIRVLVADDSPINRKVAESVLGRAGYELVMVENGQEAVEAVEAQSFSIVLMDCQMPVLDGLDATRQIRQLEADGKLAAGMPHRLPIVALTGNSHENDRMDVLDAGMDRHVAKPFRPTELLAVVAEFVKPRSSL